MAEEEVDEEDHDELVDHSDVFEGVEEDAQLAEDDTGLHHDYEGGATEEAGVDAAVLHDREVHHYHVD